MKPNPTRLNIYDGEGDRLMSGITTTDRILLLPDAIASREPDPQAHLRIMWGQHLLDDLLAGRYRSLVCGVNTTDNSRGIIAQLAALLPTSQWTVARLTDHARRFANLDQVTVIKYDLDPLEVLALLRPQGHDTLTLDDLALGFKIVAEMVARKPTQRQPSASVCFLGARANVLRQPDGQEPSFEAVLRTIYRAGYSGDVYPAPGMWEAATGVYARYPFPASLESMREGGF